MSKTFKDRPEKYRTNNDSFKKRKPKEKRFIPTKGRQNSKYDYLDEMLLSEKLND